MLTDGKNGTLEPRYFSHVDGATTDEEDSSKNITPDKYHATPRDPPPLPTGKGEGGPTRAAASRQLRARSGWMLDDNATAETKCNDGGRALAAGVEEPSRGGAAIGGLRNEAPAKWGGGGAGRDAMAPPVDVYAVLDFEATCEDEKIDGGR